jgi:hypothetical protein
MNLPMTVSDLQKHRRLVHLSDTPGDAGPSVFGTLHVYQYDPVGSRFRQKDGDIHNGSGIVDLRGSDMNQSRGRYWLVLDRSEYQSDSLEKLESLLVEWLNNEDAILTETETNL